ncbi:hypothetical protein SASPL_139270 [Salvia splendens]|uniref:Kinesin-like protein n=1 Tax=Salvia splendens TaxID=180675 RepID=A0A8X8WMV2_SALSN|nr:hypothetical protein SASPL_139270 [Salvia splendens]
MRLRRKRGDGLEARKCHLALWQAISVVNGGQDPAPNSRPSSNSGSYSGVIEFSKEDVEALLSEKPEKKEQMDDYIKRLKQCVLWFRQLEGNYVTEQENLKNLLEVAEKKCSDVELLMKEKENELNSIIIELRQNLDTLREKHTKLELDKSVRDCHGTLNMVMARENESKLAAEKVQASLLGELKQTQEDNASNIQKIQSLNDMYKRLQEYNTSLQQYNTTETRSEFEEQKTFISELQDRLADAELKITEGEKLRKKLHNTILELKGNIRVFCRVRPFLSDDGVFETRQVLQAQGWKYEMQVTVAVALPLVSMLEIYNETIRDLLAPYKSSSDASRPENGKQYNIKHDANGNTNVSDLTTMDVRSSKEVSYLLDQAAQSRSVGKTQMNEESSRSHFVFTLRITGFNESRDQQVQGVLNLIDLAGSERLSKSGATGDRLKETQPCLGGDLKTLMFVNVSPDPSSVGESVCSLRFAARVNACEIGVPS